jgi:hypothetical protein
MTSKLTQDANTRQKAQRGHTFDAAVGALNIPQTSIMNPNHMVVLKSEAMKSNDVTWRVHNGVESMIRNSHIPTPMPVCQKVAGFFQCCRCDDNNKCEGPWRWTRTPTTHSPVLDIFLIGVVIGFSWALRCGVVFSSQSIIEFGSLGCWKMDASLNAEATNVQAWFDKERKKERKMWADPRNIQNKRLKLQGRTTQEGTQHHQSQNPNKMSTCICPPPAASPTSGAKGGRAHPRKRATSKLKSERTW